MYTQLGIECDGYVSEFEIFLKSYAFGMSELFGRGYILVLVEEHDKKNCKYRLDYKADQKQDQLLKLGKNQHLLHYTKGSLKNIKIIRQLTYNNDDIKLLKVYFFRLCEFLINHTIDFHLQGQHRYPSYQSYPRYF